MERSARSPRTARSGTGDRVVLDLSPAHAAHLAWLLYAGHTHTLFIADVIADIERQLPASLKAHWRGTPCD